jgi:hypothetical protein
MEWTTVARMPFARKALNPLITCCCPTSSVERSGSRHFRYRWQALVPTPEDRFVEWWLALRKLVPKARRKVLDSLVVLVVQCIWLQRQGV